MMRSSRKRSAARSASETMSVVLLFDSTPLTGPPKRSSRSSPASRGSGLLAGRMPHATAHVEALDAEGVRAVINLCEDHEYWVGERAAVEAAFPAGGHDRAPAAGARRRDDPARGARARPRGGRPR